MSLNPSYPDSIYHLVQCINEAVQPPCPKSADTNSLPFKSEASRRKLIAAAEQLLLAARSPEENVFAIAQQPAQTTALRCAIALGIPDALPENGSSRSLDSIASEVGADKMLLSRILRACTSTHLLAEAQELHYAHNALSRALLSPANRALLSLMFDYNARSVVALPEFLAGRGWRDPGTYADCAFMLGCRTTLPMWEFRDADPECHRVFDLGMQSEIVAALSTGKASGPFPFGEELAGRAGGGSGVDNGNGVVNGHVNGSGGAIIRDSKEEDEDPCGGGDLTIVDLGGGRGQALIDMREDHPALLQGARLVLVDLGPVIDSAREAGLPPWVEPVKGSFFEPLPIQGADVYLLRRCLHNWDDAACRTILRNVAAAMDRTRSRLLVTDMVVADTNAAREMAWEDLNMMTIGGIERTERHWRELLDESGFRVHRIWSNSPVEHATIDARLK